MKKGFLLWLLQLAVFTGLYYLALHGWVSPPADWLAALGAGAVLTYVTGSFRNAWAARKVRAVLDRSLAGAPFEDGQRIAAAGPILSLGAPIHTPFSGTPCVFHFWALYHEEPSRSKEGERLEIEDFSGIAMNPCVIQAPTGNVRVLGFPVLEGRTGEIQRGDRAFANARAYLSSTSFEKLDILTAFSKRQGLIADDDGYLRKDWRLAGDDFQLDPKVHFLWEETVADGEEVCALGVYSAERKGIVPGSIPGSGLKLIPGGGAEVRKTLSDRFAKHMTAGVLLFLAMHFVLFIVSRDLRIPAEPAYVREWAFFQAVEDGDLAAVTAALDDGLGPDLRDEGGNTPLMLAQDPRIARRLILAGADVNARSLDAYTPLINAARTCNLEVVRLLLQSGADAHARDSASNRTPLEWTEGCYPHGEGYEEMVKVLRAAGARKRSS